MGNTPPAAGRGSEESYDERDIRYGGHYSKIRPDEDNTQLVEGSKIIEETNRKSNLDSSEVPRPIDHGSTGSGGSTDPPLFRVRGQSMLFDPPLFHA